MIIFTTKSITEKEPFNKDYGRRPTRWVLELTNYGIDLHQQVKFDSDLHGREWIYGSASYNIFLHKDFNFEMYHTYYDGFHCGLSLGWITFGWQSDYCKKCEK